MMRSPLCQPWKNRCAQGTSAGPNLASFGVLQASKVQTFASVTGATSEEARAPVMSDGEDKPNVKGEEGEGGVECIFLLVKGEDGNIVQFRMKRKTALKRLMEAYLQRQSLHKEEIDFRFAGTRLRAEDTPDDHYMEDDDVIDALRFQVGGGGQREGLIFHVAAPENFLHHDVQKPKGWLGAAAVHAHDEERIPMKSMAASSSPRPVKGAQESNYDPGGDIKLQVVLKEQAAHQPPVAPSASLRNPSALPTPGSLQEQAVPGGREVCDSAGAVRVRIPPGGVTARLGEGVWQDGLDLTASVVPITEEMHAAASSAVNVLSGQETKSSIIIAGEAIEFGPPGTLFQAGKVELFLPLDQGLLGELRELEVPFCVGAFRWNEGDGRWEEKHRVGTEDATGEDLRVEAEGFSTWVVGLVFRAYSGLKKKLKAKKKPKASGLLASPVGQQPSPSPTAEQSPRVRCVVIGPKYVPHSTALLHMIIYSDERDGDARRRSEEILAEEHDELVKYREDSFCLARREEEYKAQLREIGPQELFEIVEKEVGFGWLDGMAEPPKFAFKPTVQVQDVDGNVYFKSTIEIVGVNRLLIWNKSLLQRSPSTPGTSRKGLYNEQQANTCTLASESRLPRIEVFACKAGSDVDVFWEAKKIDESLAQSGDFYVHPRPLPSAEDLRDIMSKCKRDNIIGLHFAGHTGEGGGVVLEGEIEGFMASIAKEVSKRSFVEQISLGTKSTLRFVFLNACDGLGLARRLVERGVFYVVCWMHAVNDKHALLFCDRFYRWLKNNPGEYGSAFRSAAVDHPASIRARPCLLWRDKEMKGTHLDEDWVGLEGAEGAYVWADDEFQPLSEVEAGLGESSLLLSSEEEDTREEGEGGADEDGEDNEMRNWRPPNLKQGDDFGALAGQEEQRCLKALGFDLRLSGKPISIGNGIMDNGFITDDALRQLGVQSYGWLWGPSGAAVNKAFELLLVHQGERDAAAGRVESAVSHLKEVELLRQKDIDKHQAKPKKDQKRHEGHVHQLRKVQASARAMMGLLAGKKEMDVLLALGFPVETHEYMDSTGVLAKAALREIGSNSFTQVCSDRAEKQALQLLKFAGAKGTSSGGSGVERVERAVRLLEDICDNDMRPKKQMVQIKDCSETLKRLLRQHATLLPQ